MRILLLVLALCHIGLSSPVNLNDGFFSDAMELRAEVRSEALNLLVIANMEDQFKFMVRAEYFFRHHGFDIRRTVLVDRRTLKRSAMDLQEDIQRVYSTDDLKAVKLKYGRFDFVFYEMGQVSDIPDLLAVVKGDGVLFMKDKEGGFQVYRRKKWSNQLTGVVETISRLWSDSFTVARAA